MFFDFHQYWTEPTKKVYFHQNWTQRAFSKTHLQESQPTPCRNLESNQSEGYCNRNISSTKVDIPRFNPPVERTSFNVWILLQSLFDLIWFDLNGWFGSIVGSSGVGWASENDFTHLLHISCVLTQNVLRQRRKNLWFAKCIPFYNLQRNLRNI